MKIGTRQEMNQMDASAIKDFQIPSILLMEHAAYGIFLKLKQISETNIIIVCGPGNNGGDGLALARQLVTWSDKLVRVVLVTTPDKLSEDGKVYYDICKNLGVCIELWKECEHNLEAIFEDTQIVIDAIFGTGLTRPIEGFLGEVIEYINQLSKVSIISIDIPSGISCDDGRIMGKVIKADETFTFQMPKVGLHVYPGNAYAGKVHTIDIGIPKKYIQDLKTKYQCITKDDVASLILKRPMRSHKGTYGRVLIMGGSREMSGAITLTAKATMKAGAGTVTVAVPECIQDRIAVSCIDAMTVGLGCIDGHFSEEASNWLLSHGSEYDVVVLGPGIGRSRECVMLAETLLKLDVPCVIDADGLYNLKEALWQIQTRKSPVILTPHPKEFERLSGYCIEDIINNPLKRVEAFVERTGAHMTLKIERSIIGTEGEVWINTTGNPALAKGGSGDVLSGLIAGILAWSKCEKTALKVGSYIHGAAADYLIHTKGEYSLLPSELFEGIEHIFKVLEHK